MEIVGRTLRAINDRKEIFEELVVIEADPSKWSYKKLIKHKEIYKKSQYIENIKEQTINYILKNEKLPESYYDIQKTPELKQSIIESNVFTGALMTSLIHLGYAHFNRSDSCLTKVSSI